MAKATGLDAGGYAVTVVELDGSYKRPRLTKVHREKLGPQGATQDLDIEADLVAEAAAVAVAEAGVPKDGLRVSTSSRNAVLRSLDVPFKGRETIRKVIKGEVEGTIHSHAVDDMVVDFYTVAEYEEGTRVITASLPKPGLRVQLMALERADLEVEKIDLDAVALFRCAEWCGAFGEVPDGNDEEADAADENEDADASETDAPKAGAPESGAVVPAEALPAGVPVRVVVDIGGRSAKVLLVQGGVLREMRTIRIGSESITDALVANLGIAAETAHEAAWACLSSGLDQEVEGLSPASDDEPVALVKGSAVAEEADVEAVAPVGPKVVVTVAAVRAALEGFLTRFERELRRFLTSTPVDGPVDVVWITGGGSRWEGMTETLTEVFGIAPRTLPVLDRLQHRLGEEDAAALEVELAVAVGLALPGIGGPPGFNFRQEDLAFTKGFDRIKFPLAVCAMVGLFLMVVHTVKRRHDLKLLTHEYGETYYGETWEVGSNKGQPRYKYFGYVGHLANDGGWFANQDNFDRQEYVKLLNELEERPVFDRLLHINNRIKRLVDKRMEETGIFEDLQLPSGYAVLNRFAGILTSLESQLGRYQISELHLQLPASRQGRRLSFTIVLRGDMRAKAAMLKRALENDIAKPDSPFEAMDTAGREGDQFREGDEVGMHFDFQIAIKEDYIPFTEASTN